MGSQDADCSNWEDRVPLLAGYLERYRDDVGQDQETLVSIS